ncbi:MAG: hypothetical protein ACREUU_01525 [Gammaproteobacteria bacterium]
MTSRLNPPFRAEHIGSLLRPPEVKTAFARRAAPLASATPQPAITTPASRRASVTLAGRA